MFIVVFFYNMFQDLERQLEIKCSKTKHMLIQAPVQAFNMAARECVTPTNLLFSLQYHKPELVRKRQMASWLTHELVLFLFFITLKITAFFFNTLLLHLRIRMLAKCVC